MNNNNNNNNGNDPFIDMNNNQNQYQNGNQQGNNQYQNNNGQMQYQNMNDPYQNNQYQNNNGQMQYQNQNNQYNNMNNPYQNMNNQYQSMDNMIINQGQDVALDFDMNAVTEYKQRLRQTREVQALTNEIEVQNPNSIIVFGQKASEVLSKVSDELLNSMKSVKAEEATEMLTHLTKIMDKFDIKELDNVKKDSLVNKLFKGVGTTIAKLFQKYDTMGYEVEKVFMVLKRYEQDMREANANLKKLYDANLTSYQNLEKYIVAGEIAIEEVDQYLNQIQFNNQMAPEEKQMITQKLEVCKDMLAQRLYDLQVAENVAIQAAPMIQSIQMSNFNLMRKINSSFIVTLPIFKQCLAQAVILKRQEIQAKSIKQLDDKTNELIMRNAQATARQSVEIARMASGSSIAIETLEKSFETIMRGIEETKQIQDENKVRRTENSSRLERLKHEMKKNISNI